MQVVVLQGTDSACDDFVSRMESSNICHLPAWSAMVNRATGHPTYYLVARDGQTVRGVLPLTHMKTRLFGNQMISHALSNYGGPVADCPGAVELLYAKSVELAQERGCETIEFRNIEPMPFDLENRTGKVAMRLALDTDTEKVWNGFKSKTKVRNHVRKAAKAGMTAQDGSMELLDEFYKLYTIRMRQLGTPCYSRKIMRCILETFPNNSRLFVARLDNKVVSARIVFYYNKIAESSLGITRLEYNQLSPNHFLYWETMKYYCQAGADWFDFGRSTIGSTPYRFKKQWGATEIPLHYQYWVRPGHTMSVLSPDNPKYQRRIRLWKKLPLWATRLIGPRISRGLL
jgi:FemAB-related protein (PEP-CTERM system-associated)